MICVKCQIGYRHFRADIEHLGIVRDIGSINLITGAVDCDVLLDVNTRDQLAIAQQRDRITVLRRGKGVGKSSVICVADLGDRLGGKNYLTVNDARFKIIIPDGLKRTGEVSEICSERNFVTSAHACSVNNNLTGTGNLSSINFASRINLH